MRGKRRSIRVLLAVAVGACTCVLAPAAAAAPAWEALGAGVDGPVYTLLATRGDVVVGGSFEHAGGAAAGSAASWDGTAWTALGGGVQQAGDPLPPGEVHALGTAGSTTYLGGNFVHINGDDAVDVGYVARWDGTALSATPVVDADRIGLMGTVYAIDPAPDGGLYYGGSFQSLKAWWIGTPGAYSRIAKFDGTSWSPVAAPFPADESVHGIAVATDGRIAVGTLDGADGTGHVWVLASGAWSELGPGFDNAVEEVAFGPDGTLYAGGDFTFLDENPDTTYVRGLASWNPTFATWQPVGGGVNGRVHAMVFDPAGRMFVGGDFRYVDNDLSTEYGRIAMRAGAAWSAVGGGVGESDLPGEPNIVEAIAIDPTGRLVAGGSFAVAGPGGATATANVAAIDAAAPAAPVGVAASAGNARAAVSWTALAGQAAVTYTATASGGRTCTATAPATSCTITGLRNGTAYTFTVVAANEAASGPASAASAPATPRAPVPPAPTISRTTIAGNALTTTVTMRSAGTVQQVVRRRRGATWVPLCRSTRSVTAGDVKVTCPFGKAMRAALRAGRVTVSATITATPTGGRAVESRTTIRVPKRRG